MPGYDPMETAARQYDVRVCAWIQARCGIPCLVIKQGILDQLGKDQPVSTVIEMGRNGLSP